MLMTGYFVGQTVYGTTAINGTGHNNAFVAKTDPSGQLLWHWVGSGNDGVSATSVAVDSAGNAYACGYFLGTAVIGDSTFTTHGGYDIFFLKFNMAGQVQWSKRFGGPQSDMVSSFIGKGLAVRGAGCYMIGHFGYYQQNPPFSYARFGDSVLTATGPATGFLVKTDLDGTVQFAKKCGGQEQTWVYGCATDKSGNVYTTGYYGSTQAQFDSITVYSKFPTSTGQMFIAKYDSAGRIQWVNGIGGRTSGAAGNAITSDAQGNIYVAGRSGADTTYLGYGLTHPVIMNPSAWSVTAFVAKYNSSGKFIWMRKLDDSSAIDANDLLVGRDGTSLFIGGTFNGQCYFEADSFSSAGDGDIFIVRLDTAGQYQWMAEAGGLGGDARTHLAQNPLTGSICVTGYIFFNAQFGSHTLTSGGQHDGFVAMLSEATAIPSEEPSRHSMAVFPNPGKGTFTIAMSGAGQERLLTLTDLAGRKIYSAGIPAGATSHSFMVPPSVANGLYLLTLSGKEQRLQTKIVIQQ
jgi:hypothetical protein